MKKLAVALPVVALVLIAATRGNITWDQLQSSARHGTGSMGQSSDGTGTNGHFAQFNSSGALTDGGIPSGLVASVFGRTGAVTAQLSDYSSFFLPIANPTYTGNLTTPITGATQCLQVDSSGVVSGTGSACGTGGGGAVSSVFGRTGAVTAQSGDYTTSLIPEGSNLYFTNARVLSAMSGLYESPLTFVSPLSRTGNTISCPTCGGGGGGGAITVQVNGTPISGTASTINFIAGAGIQIGASGSSTVNLTTSTAFPAIATVTTTYSVATTDYTLLCDATSGGFTASLPSSPLTGMVINWKKVDSTGNACTLSGNGKTIDGSGSVAITTQYQSYQIQFNGTAWFII